MLAAGQLPNLTDPVLNADPLFGVTGKSAPCATVLHSSCTFSHGKTARQVAWKRHLQTCPSMWLHHLQSQLTFAMSSVASTIHVHSAAYLVLCLQMSNSSGAASCTATCCTTLPSHCCSTALLAVRRSCFIMPWACYAAALGCTATR